MTYACQGEGNCLRQITLAPGHAVRMRAYACRSFNPPFEMQVLSGMSMNLSENRGDANPMDLVEHLAVSHDWSFSRASEDEVTLLVAGKWTDYQVSFTWMGDIEALHLACAFEIKVPDRQRAEVAELIAMINEQLWIGHFDLWPKDGLAMFRHAMLLTGGTNASSPQCEGLLAVALDACERYYQAFQFVMWAGKSAREALDAAMFTTSGEA